MPANSHEPRRTAAAATLYICAVFSFLAAIASIVAWNQLPNVHAVLIGAGAETEIHLSMGWLVPLFATSAALAFAWLAHRAARASRG